MYIPRDEFHSDTSLEKMMTTFDRKYVRTIYHFRTSIQKVKILKYSKKDVINRRILHRKYVYNNIIMVK